MKSILILSLLVSLNAFADEAKVPAKEAAAVKPAAKVDPKVIAELEAEPPIIKGTDIEIDSYDSATDTFEVVIVKEPGVGPNVASSEDLIKATGITIGNGKKKADFVGTSHLLKEDLKMLAEDEVKARKK
ncbi:hypothetical protein ACES2L_12590 [Bdellovibrio bacteriovorus]